MRRKRVEEHENHERWLVSYADFITLLFAFFVVMYSISSVNDGKYRVLSDSMIAAFSSPNKSLSPIQIGQPLKSPYTSQTDFMMSPTVISMKNMPPSMADEIETKMNSITDDLKDEMSALIDDGLVSVHGDKSSVEIEIKSNILFRSGNAVFGGLAKNVIRKIAIIVKKYPYSIRVEGFTDNLPISTPVYPSNWELSAARAASVVRYMVNQGISPERMVAIGYGENHPVSGNDTPAGRSKNRRVMLIIDANENAKHAIDSSGSSSQIGHVGASGKPRDVTHKVITERGNFKVITGINNQR